MIKVIFKGIMEYTFMSATFGKLHPEGAEKRIIVCYCETGRIFWLDAKDCEVLIEKGEVKK